MTTTTVTPSEAIRLLRQIDEDLRAKLPVIGRRKLRRVMVNIRAKMRSQGKQPPAYDPLNPKPWVKWASQKQRRAFFATDGFGRGIPTKRTNSYVRGWEITETKKGFTLENKTKYSKWVGGTAYGKDQSPIHAGRWVKVQDVTTAELEKAYGELANEILIGGRRVVKEAK